MDQGHLAVAERGPVGQERSEEVSARGQSLELRLQWRLGGLSASEVSGIHLE